MEKYYINISNKEDFDIGIKQLESLGYKEDEKYSYDYHKKIKRLKTVSDDVYCLCKYDGKKDDIFFEGYIEIPLLEVGNLVTIGDCKTVYKIETISQGDLATIVNLKTRNKYVYKLNKLKLYGETTEDKFKDGLPKYWIVKKDTSNPLWIKFIDYIRIKYGYSVGNAYDYYGYDGTPIGINGFNCFDDRGHFKNNPTLITLEQWYSVISKSNTIKELSLEPICSTDNPSTITTDYHGNILHTNLGTMKAMNRLNDIRSEKFFNNENNLVAIETLNDTLKSGIKLMEDSIKELMDSKDKFEKLIYKLDDAANESDIKLLKDLISQTDEVKFFVKELEETKIEKYKQANESFSIKEFLKSK